MQNVHRLLQDFGKVAHEALYRVVWSPDPWADLESRTPLRVPRNYPIVV